MIIIIIIIIIIIEECAGRVELVGQGRWQGPGQPAHRTAKWAHPSVGPSIGTQPADRFLRRGSSPVFCVRKGPWFLATGSCRVAGAYYNNIVRFISLAVSKS